MKNFFIIIVLFASAFIYGQQKDAELSWETNFEKAKVKAKQENKPILVLFTGSDWCPPCKLLKKDFFNSPKFKAKSRDFVLLLVDFPRNKDLVSAQQATANKKLNSEYEVRSLPTLIALDYKGNIIDKIKGYNAGRDTRYHYEFVDKVLN
ncbi:MAG: thioredoxin family protein [Flavobacteriaceae bacterium]